MISQESTSGEENKIRWIIEVKDLYNLHKVDIMFESQYSIVHQVYEGENFIKSRSITVNKKPFSNKGQNRYSFK